MDNSQLLAMPSVTEKGQLRVMFVNTSLPVGGAETLLMNLVRRMDRKRYLPEICCLKEPGPIGELLSHEFPTFSRFLRQKYDITVWNRLTRLFRERRIDAVVTIGAGDKMFWGRLAAWRASVPVVLCALHSTGWPDVINWPNQRLTSLTDGFIAVAAPHAEYLIRKEGFPQDKVFTIANGVDTDRFIPNRAQRSKVRAALGIPERALVCGIAAALRPEKTTRCFVLPAEKSGKRFFRPTLSLWGMALCDPSWNVKLQNGKCSPVSTLWGHGPMCTPYCQRSTCFL